MPLSKTKNANEKVRCLIVDDENAGRVTLRYALARHPHWTIVGEFDNAQSTRDFLAQNEVEVIFLDIHMPQENGLHLAKYVSQLASAPLILFVSAHHAHALEAFEVHALDYILKPFKANRLAQSLERAEEILKQKQGYAMALAHFVESTEKQNRGLAPPYLEQVIVRSVGEMECIKLDAVLWIASASNYVELHLAQRTVLHRMTLSAFEKAIDPTQFIRVHRTFIVRRREIIQVRVEGDGVYCAKLNCGAEIAVSERYIDEVRACLV